MLPIKSNSRAAITELGRLLAPSRTQISETWRRRMAEEFAFDERVMSVLERVNVASGLTFFTQEEFESYSEHLTYYGTRLAKLKVDTRAVARSLDLWPEVCEPFWAGLNAEKKAEARAALDSLTSQIFVILSGSYFDTQRKESSALIAVLDAELAANNVPVLLQRVLQISTTTFNATVGVVLLRDPESGGLRAKAAVGLDDILDEDLCVMMGQGFSGTIATTGEPAMLPDLRQSNGVLNPVLRKYAQALWGVPLKIGENVTGVLLLGFSRRYEWLPTERELLRAVADRSALAIERARIAEALREREMQIAELSAHLLRAQEQERKRISRELHDETGQALMVIRLYLGMLDGVKASPAVRDKVREVVEIVDRSVVGLRRIIGRLSPLVLQELGLIAAIRKEAKDLAKNCGIKTNVEIDEKVGRLDSDVEGAIYRVVQEALHNVAKHAHAKTVAIQMTRQDGLLNLVIEDDGVGISRPSGGPTERPTFGLQGIKERIAMLGGTVRIRSAKSEGTRLEIDVPAARSGLETLFPQTLPALNARDTGSFRPN